MGGKNTVSGYIKNFHPEAWTIQIEINCKITNNKDNFEKFENLLNCFSNWLDCIIKKNNMNNQI